MKKRKNFSQIIVVITVVLIVIVCLLAYIYSGTAGDNCGSDAQCFYDKANECLPATLLIDFDGSILEYTSTEDCIIIKKVIKVSSDEPQEVKDYLEGKEMVCRHDKYYLNTTVITAFSGGMSDCSGELKDAIIDMRLVIADIEADNMTESMWGWYDIS